MGGSLRKKQCQLTTLSFNILVVGASQSGKTSVIQRYTSNQFQGTPYTPTCRAQLTAHTLRVPGKRDVVASITFWEIPADPLPLMKQKLYSDANGVLVVVDASSHSDTDLVKDALKWKEDVLAHCKNQFVPFVLLVNKCNQLYKTGSTLITDLREAAKENNFVTCVEVNPQHGDRSVLSAVNGLIRLLVDELREPTHLATLYPTYPNLKEVLSIRKISTMDAVPPDVPMVGMQEQDDMMVSCWQEVESIKSCRRILEKGLTKFTMESIQEQLITDDKSGENVPSVEQCITGLRQRLPGCYDLEIVYSGSTESLRFPQLTISEKCLFRSSHEVLKLLYIYHSEIAAPGKHLLCHIPLIEEQLNLCKVSLCQLQSSRSVEHTPQGSQNLERRIEKAIDKVGEWKVTISETLRNTRQLTQGVLEAVLWNTACS